MRRFRFLLAEDALRTRCAAAGCIDPFRGHRPDTRLIVQRLLVNVGIGQASGLNPISALRKSIPKLLLSAQADTIHQLHSYITGKYPG